MTNFSSRLRIFISDFESKKDESKFWYLVLDFLHNFRNKDTWEIDIFPLVESVRTGNTFGEDWTDFVWGSVCFRKDHVMFLDEKIHQIGRKFPPVSDNDGNPIVDETGQWLENTDYIESNYTEFLKMPLDEFISICRKWYNEVL